MEYLLKNFHKMGILNRSLKTAKKRRVKPLGLKKIYFDVKNKIECFEVLRETSDGTIVCWEPVGEVPIPFKRSDYKRQEGGFWASESAAAKSAVKRLQTFVAECEKEIIFFNKLT